jgi:hypothetical protein
MSRSRCFPVMPVASLIAFPARVIWETNSRHENPEEEIDWPGALPVTAPRSVFRFYSGDGRPPEPPSARVDALAPLTSPVAPKNC